MTEDQLEKLRAMVKAANRRGWPYWTAYTIASAVRFGIVAVPLYIAFHFIHKHW